MQKLGFHKNFQLNFRDLLTFELTNIFSLFPKIFIMSKFLISLAIAAVTPFVFAQDEIKKPIEGNDS